MDLVYLVSAVAGGTLFLVQFILQFTGIFDDISGDLDGGTDFDSNVHGDTSGGSDLSFQYLSFQAVSAFFMVFGLTGLAFHRQSHVSPGISLPVSVIAGLATLRIISWIYEMINSLQSTGNLDLSHVAGSEGRVYARIPVMGSGQVQIRVEGRFRTYDARSADGSELETGTTVRVVSMTPDNNMIVEKVN